MIFQRFQSADAAADENAEAVWIFVCHLDAGIGHRHFRRRHRELGEAIGAPHILRVLENSFRIEVAHFSADAAIVSSGIEGFDFTNAADAVLQVRPKSLEIVAEGRDCTHSGDNDSAVVIHLVI